MGLYSMLCICFAGGGGVEGVGEGVVLQFLSQEFGLFGAQNICVEVCALIFATNNTNVYK